jgi:hypothetical protein
MLRAFATSALLTAALAMPALAQSSAANPPAQTIAPSTQNSGAGVPGQSGNQSGPAARSGTDTTGTTSNSGQNSTTRQQDSSGVQGMPGNKSGPPPVRSSDK